MFRWPIRVKLGWCSNCGVPLIQEICDRCGSRGVEVKASPPADARPMFDGDARLIREALINEFKDPNLAHALGIDEGSLVLLNKVSHYDDMKEVISGGVVVGRYFFDPVRLRWRWRLSRYSAKVALERGVVKSIITDRIKPLAVLGSSNDDEDTQYVVLNRSGDILGLAVVRNGMIRVQSLFTSSPMVSGQLKGTAAIDVFIKANELKLRTLISKGIKRLYVMSSKVGLPLTASFSGGKDSLVALDLAVRCGLEPKIVFNDTGLELPETLSNVETVSVYYGLELIVAKPRRSFWETLDAFGPPARDFRWCCKVLKLIPLSEAYKRSFPGGALNIVGQRGLESIDRARSGNVWRNRWVPGVLNVTPIQEWPKMAVWSYVLANRLPYNPLYTMGFDRLGCYLCPAATIAEYFTVKRLYPDLWSKWEDYLLGWCSRLSLPDEWVRYSLWRWLNPLASGRVRVERKVLGGGPRNSWTKEYGLRLGLEVVKSELAFQHARLVFDEMLGYAGMVAQAGILGRVDLEVTDRCLYVYSESYLAAVSRNSIEVAVKNPSKYSSLSVLALMLKLLMRWARCISCGVCTLWCPTGAARVVSGRPMIRGDVCTGCGICLEVCPISEVLVNKVLVPLVTNEPGGTKGARTSKVLELSRALRRAGLAGFQAASQEQVLDADQISWLFKQNM